MENNSEQESVEYMEDVKYIKDQSKRQANIKRILKEWSDDNKYDVIDSYILPGLFLNSKHLTYDDLTFVFEELRSEYGLNSKDIIERYFFSEDKYPLYSDKYFDPAEKLKILTCLAKSDGINLEDIKKKYRLERKMERKEEIEERINKNIYKPFGDLVKNFKCELNTSGTGVVLYFEGVKDLEFQGFSGNEYSTDFRIELPDKNIGDINEEFLKKLENDIKENGLNFDNPDYNILIQGERILGNSKIKSYYEPISNDNIHIINKINEKLKKKTKYK